MSTMKLIKTSEPDWIKSVAEAYKKHSAFQLADDAHTGIDPNMQTVFQRHIV